MTTTTQMFSTIIQTNFHMQFSHLMKMQFHSDSMWCLCKSRTTGAHKDSSIMLFAYQDANAFSLIIVLMFVSVFD